MIKITLKSPYVLAGLILYMRINSLLMEISALKDYVCCMCRKEGVSNVRIIYICHEAVCHSDSASSVLLTGADLFTCT